MRRSQRHARGLTIYLLALAQSTIFAGCGHQTIDGHSAQGATSGNLVAGILGTNDVGQAIYQLYYNDLSQNTDPGARAAELAALAQNQSDFVGAVNDVLSIQNLQNSLQSAQGLMSLVDDGTIPQLAQDGAQILGQLQNDPAALAAVTQIIQAAPGSPGIPVDDTVSLLGRLANYPDTGNLWSAASLVIQNNPQVLTAGLGLASRKLEALTPPSSTATSGLATFGPNLVSAFLDPAQLTGGQSFGVPAWVVTLDSRGLQQVAIDPATGQLVAPFVDNGSGQAQVDGQGNFIDANGAVIDLAPFGAPSSPGFDVDGRAISASGALYYVYFDAKQTVLALDMKLGGDFLAAGADVHGYNVLSAALGPQTSGGGYSDGAVADLAFGALQMVSPADAPAMLGALAALLKSDPARAEQLLVLLSNTIVAIRAAQKASANAGGIGSLSISSPQVVTLTDNLLPLVDDVCTQPSTGGPSTTRVLFNTLQDLSTAAPTWPSQLAPLFVMHQLSPAVAVDFTKAATYTDSKGNTVDNRSSVNTLLDLLATANGCQAPLMNESLAVLIMNLMAGLTPSTVSTLSSLVTAVPGFLTNLVCPGMSNDLNALNDLATSGSLDALLPIAAAFKNQGQTQLLVNILVRVDQSYPGTLRGIEPDVNKILTSGAVEQLTTLLGETTTITDPTTGRNVADITCDSIANLVNQHSSTVVNRQGQHVPSLAYLLILPLRGLDQSIQAAGVSADLTALGDAAQQIVLATAKDPTTGQTVLANGSIVPFATKVLSALASAIPTDAATRQTDLTDAEGAIATFVQSPDMGTLMSIEGTILGSSSVPAIDAAIVNMLTPNVSTPDDIFGAVVKLLCIELQKLEFLSASSLSSQTAPLVALANFVGQAIDPSTPVVQDIVTGVTKVLIADQQPQTVLKVLRAALNPQSATLPPATIIIHILQSVSLAGSQSATTPSAAVTQQDVQNWLASAVAFINNQQSGLPYIFQLIKNRTK